MIDERAILRWKDGRELRGSVDEGWVADDRAFVELLDAGWPLRRRVQRPGHDLVSSVAREVARVFSADVLVIEKAAATAPRARERAGEVA